MSYQIIPNIIFIFAVLGIILIILRHLPEAASLEEEEKNQQSLNKLLVKGLPAEAISKTKVLVKFWIKKSWNFILEAKDLRPGALSGYRIKKMFSQQHSAKPVSAGDLPTTTQEVKNEHYFLEAIKREPKNLEHYDALGKFYLDTGNITDAKDIFQYLTHHKSTNPDYYAKLANCFYRLQQYDQAAANYRKSLGLDSSQPNRYYNLGLSLEAGGEMDQAIEAFQQAIALEPQNRKFHNSLSNAFSRLGQQEKALAASVIGDSVKNSGEDIKVPIKKK